MSVIIYIIQLLVCAFIGRSLGEKRRIGATAGFVIGLLLGVPGLIIVVLSRRVPSDGGVPVDSSKRVWIHEEEPKDYHQASRSETKSTPYEDESILMASRSGDTSFLDELTIEVCLHGDQLDKYERIVVKKYGSDTYAHLARFVEEVSRSVQKGRFTNTSIANLGYLGKSVGLNDSTIEEVVKKCSVYNLVNSLSSK